MEKLIKGQKIKAWEDWIDNELSPPVKIDGETKYVLEAFKEALNIIKNQNSQEF